MSQKKNRSKPIISTDMELFTAKRLLRFSALAVSNVEKDDKPYEAYILEQIFLYVTTSYSNYAGMSQHEVFERVLINDQPLLFLKYLFQAELLGHFWGPLLLQALQMEMPLLRETNIKLSKLPPFLLPLHCIACGRLLSNINEDNANAQVKLKCSVEDSFRHNECKQWIATIRATFQSALLCLEPSTTIPLAEQYKQILGAYAILASQLESKPYEPHYMLYPEYKEIDLSWFVQHVIMGRTNVFTGEHLPKFFSDELVGKSISVFENDEGEPVNDKGDRLSETHLTFYNLKQYFRKPTRR